LDIDPIAGQSRKFVIQAQPPVAVSLTEHAVIVLIAVAHAEF
jgi:hypothetical protein